MQGPFPAPPPSQEKALGTRLSVVRVVRVVEVMRVVRVVRVARVVKVVGVVRVVSVVRVVWVVRVVRVVGDVLSPKITQPRSQVFSLNGSIICSGLHL